MRSFKTTGLEILAKLAADPAGSSEPSNTSPASTPSAPKIDLGADKRTQEVHEQQLQFNEDKHQLELAKLQQQLQQSQESFQIKQEQDQAKQQQTQEKEQVQQQEQQAMDQQQQQMLQQQQGQQYQQNIMAKAAAMYTDEVEPMEMPSIAPAAPAALVGMGTGGAAAHFIAPTAEAQRYREMAAEVGKGDTDAYFDFLKKKGKNLSESDWKKVVGRIDDTTNAAHLRKTQYLNRALQANAKRVAKGAGAGLLAGLTAYSAMKE